MFVFVSFQAVTIQGPLPNVSFVFSYLSETEFDTNFTELIYTHFTCTLTRLLI